MRLYIPALWWAALIFAVALAGRFGLADREGMAMLAIVLPAIAFATFLRGDACCRRRHT